MDWWSVGLDSPTNTAEKPSPTHCEPRGTRATTTSPDVWLRFYLWAPYAPAGAGRGFRVEEKKHKGAVEGQRLLGLRMPTPNMGMSAFPPFSAFLC